METAAAGLRVALSFHQGGVANRARVATEDVTTEVDAKMLHVSKSLYDSAELKAIRHLNNEVRNHIRSRTTPSFLRSGIYLIKLVYAQEVKDYLEAKYPELRKAVEEFVAVMPAAQQEAKERLGKHYDEADYPTPAAVRAAFTWSYEFLSLEAPTELKRVSLAFYQEAEKKAKAQMKKIVEEIEGNLIEQTLGLVDRVIESLKPDADGKVKAFRAPVITNVEKFLDLLPYRETGNEKLKEVTDKMRAAVNGLDAGEVRKDRDVAVALAGRFDEMKSTLAALAVARPSRRIKLGDEAAA